MLLPSIGRESFATQNPAESKRQKEKHMNEQLQALAAWIKQFPQWGDQTLSVDQTPPKPGGCGLFPIGEEEIARSEDVLGNTKCRYRGQYLLRRMAIRGEDAAGWLMAFGRWARSANSPQMGENCVARATRGRLLTSVNTGIATYEIRISMEYTEEIKHGEN